MTSSAHRTGPFGFDAVVTITNTSDSRLIGWRSAFTLPGGYWAVSAQNADLVERGNSGVVSGTGTVGAGETLIYEVSAAGAGSVDPPSNLTLNGIRCDA